MALAKKTYTDLVTVIPAGNLNDIQDSIITLENAKTADEVVLNNLRTDVDENTDSIGDLSDLTTTAKTDLVSAINEAASSGSGVPTNVRQAILSLFESAAYAETGLTDEIAIIESWASEVTDITLSASTLSLNADTPQMLVATTVPSGSTVVWSSSDTSIATVTGGVVTGVSNGTCRITATAGDKSATCAVTVSGFVTLESISAVYTQSGTVYDTDSLDSLKADLVVTATYDDSTTATVPSTDYVLSGTLTVGTSTIAVSYSGKTTTFNVTVTASPYLFRIENRNVSVDDTIATGVNLISTDIDFSLCIDVLLTQKNGDWKLCYEFENASPWRGITLGVGGGNFNAKYISATQNLGSGSSINSTKVIITHTKSSGNCTVYYRHNNASTTSSATISAAFLSLTPNTADGLIIGKHTASNNWAGTINKAYIMNAVMSNAEIEAFMEG